MQSTIQKQTLIALGAIGLLILALAISARRTEAQYASPVNVMNSPAVPANIRDSDQGARHPFQAGAPVAIGCSPGPVMNVPAGKEAVIEYVSFHGDTASVNAPDLEIGVTQGGVPTFHHVIMYAEGPSQIINGGTHFVAGQQLRLYGDPGTSITISACAGGTGMSATFPSVSGYFVSVP